MASDRDIKFVYDSNGQVTEDEFVIVSSTDLLVLFSEDELQQLSTISWSKRASLIEERIKSANGPLNTSYAMV